jgi:hypothetical protein
VRGLLRIAAVVLFVLAVLAGAGWLLADSTHNAVTFIAAGLLCVTLSTVPGVPEGFDRG